MARKSETDQPRKIMQLLLLLLLWLVSTSGKEVTASEHIELALAVEAAYPEWAHDHWVWLASEYAARSSEEALVEGYLSRNISVGAVNIDSQWATGDNTFVFNASKYPDAHKMIERFHAQGQRVILWATCFVNDDAPNYAEAVEGDYLMFNATPVSWWHGVGGMLNYSDAAAVGWWHKQMDNVLTMGVDGFKVDEADTEIYQLLSNFSDVRAHEIYRRYAHDYYSDFFKHARSRNADSLIMSRPVDLYNNRYHSFSPRDVVFSGWVGDQHPTFDGLRAALQNILHSAWRGYVGFGSDIGGFLSGGPLPYGRSPHLFIRWAQLGAFCPLMENGGRNVHRPWLYPGHILDTYRRFVDAHYQLKAYLLSAGTEALHTNRSIIAPLAKRINDVRVGDEPTTYDYMLGADIFVAPMVDNGTERLVHFPATGDWLDFFDHLRLFAANSSELLHVPYTDFPAFQRRGSMLPLVDLERRHPLRASVAHRRRHAEPLLVRVAAPRANDSARAIVRQWRGPSQLFEMRVEPDGTFHFDATAHQRPFRIALWAARDVTPTRLVDHLNATATVLDRRDDTGAILIAPHSFEHGVHLSFPMLAH
jgi:alpha-glucosidase (family GH31 glycosyl hydrolase)